MAKAPQGIMGPFSGKAGTVIGYTLNGQHLIRSLPHVSTKKPTTEVKNNRGKLKVLSAFIRHMDEYLIMAFTPEARGTVKNWHNLAIQYNNPTAIKGYYPDLEIDYPNVVLSRGNLKQPVNTRVERTEGGLKFSWDVNEEDKWSKDQVMIMAYFPGDHSTEYETGGAKRSDGEDTLVIPKCMMKLAMEIFISFVSNDRQEFSNSLYVGRIEAIEADPKSLKAEPAKAIKAKPSKKQTIEYEGKNEARQQLMEVARNLKTIGVSVADIAQATKLSVEEIETL